MKILVTGAKGFVGRNLCAELKTAVLQIYMNMIWIRIRPF